MAKKILVAVDFSKNSTSAVRFAIQLASQTKQSLVFFHCLPYLQPTRWSKSQYERYAAIERENVTRELEQFVRNVLRGIRTKKPPLEYLVKHSTDIDRAILRQARNLKATAICMSTRGAGRIKKFVGSHTSSIINKSTLPVFVVPATYKRGPIRHIVYASDLNRIGPELKQVRKLAKPLKAKITVLHYDYLIEVKEAREKLEKVAKKYKAPDVKFRFRKYNIDKTLATHLLNDIKNSKASLAVLFSDRRRGWFDRLFLSSKSVDVAYKTHIPLLITPRDE